MEQLKQYINDELNLSIELKKDFIQKNTQEIEKLAKLMAELSNQGKMIFYFGNGGSAADSQHLAAEHVNKLRIKRKALPAIALTTDSSVITSIANDISFDAIFERQIEALAKSGDLAIGISTSGNSENVIRGLKIAKTMGLTTVSFTGGNGGKIKAEKLSDINFNVDNSTVSSRIQESHIFLGHILIELMDKILVTKN
ncbi:MAG TPA: SIS domain-containing protein [bacterium]|nr:SIS domain-containing protein [bacterium]